MITDVLVAALAFVLQDATVRALVAAETVQVIVIQLAVVNATDAVVAEMNVRVVAQTLAMDAVVAVIVIANALVNAMAMNKVPIAISGVQSAAEHVKEVAAFIVILA